VKSESFTFFKLLLMLLMYNNVVNVN